MSLLYNKSKNVNELKPKDFKVTSLNKNIELNNEKPNVTIYYAHWCPHCHNPETIEFMEALGESLPKKANINVNAFNCDYNSQHQDIAEDLNIMGFPTIRYTNAKGKVNEYMGPKEIKPFVTFLVKNS